MKSCRETLARGILLVMYYLVAHIVGITFQEILQGLYLVLGVGRQIDCLVFILILIPGIDGYRWRRLRLVVPYDWHHLRSPAYQFTPYIFEYLPVRQQLDVSISLIVRLPVCQIYRHVQQISCRRHLTTIKMQKRHDCYRRRVRRTIYAVQV